MEVTELIRVAIRPIPVVKIAPLTGSSLPRSPISVKLMASMDLVALLSFGVQFWKSMDKTLRDMANPAMAKGKRQLETATYTKVMVRPLHLRHIKRPDLGFPSNWELLRSPAGPHQPPIARKGRAG